MSDAPSRSRLSIAVAKVLRRPLWASAMILISLAVLSVVIGRSFLFSDDFLNFARARELPFFAWLNADLFGHWLPGRKALDWGLGVGLPIQWGAVVSVLVALIGIASLLTRLAVIQLTGSAAWGSLVAIALPLTAAIPGTAQWYAGAAQVVPAIACGAALVVLVLWSPGAAQWKPVALTAVALIVPLGLLFDERMAVTALAAPLFLCLMHGGRTMWSSIAASYAVIVPVVGVWYLAQTAMTPDTPSTVPADPLRLAEFMFKAVMQNTMPALFGWVTRPVRGSEDILWIVAVFVVIILGCLVYASGARLRAVAALGIWVLVVVGVVLPAGVVRAGEAGVSSALEPRYVAIAMPIGLIAVAYVAHLAWHRRQSAHLTWTAVVLAGVVAAGGLTTLIHLSGHTVGAPSREWAQRVNDEAERRGISHFYNTPVPGYVVPPGFYPYSMTAVVLPQIRAGVDTRVTEPTAGLVLGDGSVVRTAPEHQVSATFRNAEGLVSPTGDRTGVDGEVCAAAGLNGGRLTFDVPPAETEGVSVITVHGTFSNGGILFAGPSSTSLRDKTHGIGGFPPQQGSDLWVTTEEFDDLAVIVIEIPAGERTCISAVEVGTLPATD
jgi:hypothetical protein